MNTIFPLIIQHFRGRPIYIGRQGKILAAAIQKDLSTIVLTYTVYSMPILLCKCITSRQHTNQVSSVIKIITQFHAVV